MGEDRFLSTKLFNLVLRSNMKLVDEDKAIFCVNRVHTLKEYYKQQLWYGRTYPLFSKISGYGAVKSLSFYANTLFALTFGFILFIPKYPILAINILPLLGGGLFFIIKGLRRKSILLYMTLYFLYLVGGFAKGIGLLMYLFGKKSGTSE
jgi:hypothetical protein